MSSLDSVSYFITLIAITLAPGPVALLLIVRSASRDIQGALSFGVGFAVGGVVIISVVYFGFGAWLATKPDIFSYSKYLMFGYILWLAYDIWNGDLELKDSADKVADSGKSLCAGALACFISPYMVFLFPLVLPEILETWEVNMSEFLFVIMLTFLALASGCLLLIAFASQLCRVARSRRSTVFLNRSLATILVMGGGYLGFA